MFVGSKQYQFVVLKQFLGVFFVSDFCLKLFFLFCPQGFVVKLFLFNGLFKVLITSWACCICL